MALALLQASGFKLSRERLRDGNDKLRILRAVDQARACIPLRAVLRFLRLSPSRFQAWRRRQRVCALEDDSSCPRTSPHRLMRSEIQAIGAMVTSPEYEIAVAFESVALSAVELFENPAHVRAVLAAFVDKRRAGRDNAYIAPDGKPPLN